MRYRRVPSLRPSLVVVLTVLIVSAVLLGDGRVARADHNFQDVPDSVFYHDFVSFLVDNGLTVGCGGGNFCGQDPVTRGSMAVFLQRFANVIGTRLKFGATLSGAQEVPAVSTATTGSVEVTFDDALTQATFRIVVNNGVNVTMAHFHCHRPGQNGPVVAFLFGPVAGTNVNGELAAGTLTNADIAAVDCVTPIGRPVNNLASLAFAARDGLIYANVHTVANSGGEIRGQLLVR